MKKILKIIGIVLVAIIVIAAIATMGDDEKEKDSSGNAATTQESQEERSQGQQQEESEAQAESSEPEEESNAYAAGTYIVGQDLAAGTYYISTDTMCYWELTSDSSGDLESIVANGNITTHTYVTVSDGQYFKVQGGEFLPAEDVEHTLQESFGDGMYLVGIDIPAGEYALTPDQDTITKSLYYEVAPDASHNIMNIVTNGNVQGNDYITVSDGQYLTIQGGTAELVK